MSKLLRNICLRIQFELLSIKAFLWKVDDVGVGNSAFSSLKCKNIQVEIRVASPADEEPNNIVGSVTSQEGYQGCVNGDAQQPREKKFNGDR